MAEVPQGGNPAPCPSPPAEPWRGVVQPAAVLLLLQLPPPSSFPVASTLPFLSRSIPFSRGRCAQLHSPLLLLLLLVDALQPVVRASQRLPVVHVTFQGRVAPLAAAIDMPGPRQAPAVPHAAGVAQCPQALRSGPPLRAICGATGPAGTRERFAPGSCHRERPSEGAGAGPQAAGFSDNSAEEPRGRRPLRNQGRWLGPTLKPSILLLFLLLFLLRLLLPFIFHLLIQLFVFLLLAAFVIHTGVWEGMSARAGGRTRRSLPSPPPHLPVAGVGTLPAAVPLGALGPAVGLLSSRAAELGKVH
mmetsp:Transcript_25752/g.72057  ORF Transcript_25752/g.72057 Transcript_25752/m.72057 type:complete len:303 (+) Transcript_25752:1076-1984(+)